MARLEYSQLEKHEQSIAVVGLGYVGLPLAVALAHHFRVTGFDISRQRIEELKQGRDSSREVREEKLLEVDLEFTQDPAKISSCRLVIVTVPTPVDKNRKPDLSATVKASTVVGRNMSAGSLVVYESTFYPGLTEEVCIPLLERESGLKCGNDFWVGYSPERINPGDKEHTLENIVKLVAGQDSYSGDLLEKVYAKVIKAGVHKVSNIKAAEAAKVIENTQRDLNIALMNELSIIFHQMGIDTKEVLEAAGTKWNFLPFYPGLVGGHCIGVDPYYLTYKAEELNYYPQVILAGRRINDNMAQYVAQCLVKKIIQMGCVINGARIGILGLTFKENVPDLRNTKVLDLVHEFQSYCVQVLVHDPLVEPEAAKTELGIEVVPWQDIIDLDCLILAVPHADYGQISLNEIAARFKDAQKGLLVDLKGVLDASEVQKMGLHYWRL